MSPRSQLLLWFAVSSLSACTRYEALTPPPPGRTATLNNANDEIVLSPGVALAFKCTTFWSEPCSVGRATVDDPKIAAVHPAHLEGLEWHREGMSIPTSYVVVGLKPGETVLRIVGEGTLRVIVRE